MDFNPAKFSKQQFESRTAQIEVDSLWPWFDGLTEEENNWFNLSDEEKKKAIIKGGKLHHCYWTVRGLTATEMAKMFASADKEKDVVAVIQALSDSTEKINELKEVIGVGVDTPFDIKKRLEQLVFGSINPVITLDIAVKLAEKFPIEFYMLTNKITMLTGLGMDLKK